MRSNKINDKRHRFASRIIAHVVWLADHVCCRLVVLHCSVVRMGTELRDAWCRGSSVSGSLEGC